MFKIALKNAITELRRIKDDFGATKNGIISNKVRLMTREMREATPVDTGRARDSWKLELTSNKEQPYKVTNNAPYIEYLNAGSSKQAPPFFIDKIALKYGKPVGAVVTIKENPEASI